MESEKGTVIFIPQGLGYVQTQLEDSEFICFHFNSLDLLNSQPFALKPLDDGNFRRLFYHLLELWNENPETSSVSIMIAAYKILEAIIVESEDQIPSNSSQAVLQALKFMRRKFTDPHLTITDCADTADISEIYLRRLFKKNFNKSPGQYICDLRVEHAKTLLTTGYYSVMEVAARSGFSSPSYFCSVFKARLGFSPLEYIRNQ
jgi:AraC-like DNA-binding protein